MWGCHLWMEVCFVSPLWDLQTFPHSAQTRSPPEVAAIGGEVERKMREGWWSPGDGNDKGHVAWVGIMKERVRHVLNMMCNQYGTSHVFLPFTCFAPPSLTCNTDFQTVFYLDLPLLWCLTSIFIISGFKRSLDHMIDDISVRFLRVSVSSVWF